MIRTVCAGCIAAILSVGVGLGVQAAQAPAAGSWSVKVTGCLAKDTNQFSLTSAMVEPVTGSAGTGAGAMPDSLKNATTFRVEGSGLDSHVSEKVEVTGTATPPPPPPTPAPGAAAAGGAGATAGAGRGGAGGLANAARLNVTSVKTIHGYPCF